ncbi:MAG: class I SAM-dependent methyltransferase [Candidatus Kariarchaeaceae archaeon]|jgi:ubiquinone/menaquinone biosynthesis C-methylase UbiE
MTSNGENIKKLTKIQFGREAEKYITSKVHSNKEDLEFACAFINPQAHWSVLDIATGTGHLAFSLAPFVKHVEGGDITPNMLKQAEKVAKERDILNFTIKELDVHDIPYDNESFDLVTSRIAPHHFHNIKKAISEMVRVLKKDGFLFIQDTISPEDNEAEDFINHIEKLRDPSHVRTQSVSGWKRLLENNNCEVLKVEKKLKEWPLKWWMDRMSTPVKSRNKIMEMLSTDYLKYQELRIAKNNNNNEAEERWTIFPYNGYFLARKRS